MPDTSLFVAWACVLGLGMFFVSAAAYPYLGLPPAWLIGAPFASMIYVLCSGRNL